MPRRYTLQNILAGQRFGKLTVTEPAKLVIRWKCVCDCGKVTYASAANLARGAHRSCGCLLADQNTALYTTHGQSYSPIYGLWANMLNRCNNPKTHNYKRYGGRGITVCAGWRLFENFFRDVGQYRPSKKHSLDRKDNDKGYWCGQCEECVANEREPNCRWATQSEQSRNTSVTLTLTFKDQTRTLYEWATITGLPFSTIVERVRRRWPVEDVLTTPKLACGQRRKSSNSTPRSGFQQSPHA